MTPQDMFCVACRIEAANDERPITPLLATLFRQPRPAKKRLGVAAQKVYTEGVKDTLRG